MNRGILIVFEGCDRVGKSTQLKKLSEYLHKENIKNEVLSFPNRSTLIGQVLNKYLLKVETLPVKAVHLLFSANRWEFEQKMTELIEKGTTLIIDRYSFSGVAFSTAKEIVDWKWCWQPEVGLPKPDLVLFLTMPLQEAAVRSNFGNEIHDDITFQEKVMANFQIMADQTWQIINADRDVNVVHEEVLIHVRNIMKEVGSKPLMRFI